MTSLPVWTPRNSSTDLSNFMSADIKALTESSPQVVSSLGPAFEKYNEEQFATVKLPGSSENVSTARHGMLKENIPRC